MSLDLHKVAGQIEAAASALGVQGADRNARLEQARSVLTDALPEDLEEKRQLSRATFLIPGLGESISGRHLCPALPSSYTAMAVDGSHIDVDRHLPVQCFLINIGRVRIEYGETPGAWLDSEPRLYAGDEDLYVFEPEGNRYRPLEGPLLGAMRAVEELRALATLARQSDPDIPTIALIDGSLILWGLAGQAHPEFVRSALLKEQFLPAMEDLRRLSKTRPLALASYISLPRSTDVVNALRLDASLCHYEAANCDMHCRTLRPGQRPCDGVSGVLDRELFGAVLEESERSDLFESTSTIVEQYDDDHRVHFYYLNAGSELARVEVPRWVAGDGSLLGLTHGLLIDQCRKGHGYPVAISEAHEQAVVTVGDREEFRLIVEDALQRQRLPVYTSEKNRSKRMKWL